MSGHGPDGGVVHSPADGWVVHYDLYSPPEVPRGAVLLVPASKHERDGYGPLLVDELTDRGVAVMTLDVRGRGDSRIPSAFESLPPGHRRAMTADTAAALHELARRTGVEPGRLLVAAEQDTAASVTDAALADGRVGGLLLLSAHLHPATSIRGVAVAALTSKEDRRGLRDTVLAFAASSHPASRLRVVEGVGAGTTMFAAWQYLHPEQPTLERWLAAWCAMRLSG